MGTRRAFLWQTGLAGLAAEWAWPGRTWGYVANEAVRIGIIGYGGRCRALATALAKIGGFQFTAVCDVYDRNLEAAKELAGPSVFATKDFRALLDRNDVDAVLIATPDHWHCPITIAACAAGKDVYVEKPLTHDLSEGSAVIEAEKKHQRVVQVGMQQRSMTHLQEAFEIVRSGELGPIHKVHLTWNRNHARGSHRPEIDEKAVDWRAFLGNAPMQPFSPQRFAHWRWYWDFGGGILTDLMVHWMDVVNWYLDLDTPTQALTVGDRFMPEWEWETPDTVQTLVRYAKEQTQVYFEGTFVNHRNRAMAEFMGRQATLYIDRGRFEIHPENGRGSYREQVLGQGERGQDFYNEPPAEVLHLSNWLECIRSRMTPRCSAEIGVKAVYASHLGNRSYRTGQVASWRS